MQNGGQVWIRLKKSCLTHSDPLNKTTTYINTQSFGGGYDTGYRACMGDMLASLLCFPLVLAQLLRHLFDFRGPWDSRWPLDESDVETIV
jgi:hypothetical protein